MCPRVVFSIPGRTPSCGRGKYTTSHRVQPLDARGDRAALGTANMDGDTGHDLPLVLRSGLHRRHFDLLVCLLALARTVVCGIKTFGTTSLPQLLDNWKESHDDK